MVAGVAALYLIYNFLHLSNVYLLFLKQFCATKKVFSQWIQGMI